MDDIRLRLRKKVSFIFSRSVSQSGAESSFALYVCGQEHLFNSDRPPCCKAAPHTNMIAKRESLSVKAFLNAVWYHAFESWSFQLGHVQTMSVDTRVYAIRRKLLPSWKAKGQFLS